MNIALIKGGQLGLMIIQEGIPLGDSFWVVDADKNASCHEFARESSYASEHDTNALVEFSQNCDALIVEYENINVEALEKLKAKGVKVFPPPEVLKIIQDKTLQKQFFDDHGIPTAPWFVTEGINSCLLSSDLGWPLVCKQAMGGYDGYGVCIAADKKELPQWGGKVLFEQYIKEKKELAVVVARDIHGNMKTYPVVEMVFNEKKNILDYLISPAQIDPDCVLKATALAEKIAEKLQITGILAVEMFLDSKGELLVNELAPRVHNSGHVSLGAHETSQFQQLLRIVHGFPLGETTQEKPAAMINLLASGENNGEAQYSGLEIALSVPGVTLQLYRKHESRPGRKMGHITVTADTFSQLQEKINTLCHSITITSS